MVQYIMYEVIMLLTFYIIPFKRCLHNYGVKFIIIPALNYWSVAQYNMAILHG